jgi:hypothetical protein
MQSPALLRSRSNASGLVPINALVFTKQNHSRLVDDPETIMLAPCWGLRSALPSEMTPWLGLQLEGLHYTQTGVIQQDFRRLKHHSND